MILKASQRAGAVALGLHLLKAENEHVEVHEIRGFVADDVVGAFKEAQAISRGTKCRQFLFSLSLSPPETERVEVSAFEDAIARIEKRLCLTEQPRVVVFHEKEGRRHAHCVWSRIDAETMTAISLPHFKFKLTDISRTLYLEHGWRMPDGLIAGAVRKPLNFDLKEWQQARRAGQDPRMTKALFQHCWEISDNGQAFARALESHGYLLAKGDRRAVVAVDAKGEVYAVARLANIRTKEVTARLGDLEALPSVEQAKQTMAKRLIEKLDGFSGEVRRDFEKAAQALEAKRLVLVEQHRAHRRNLRAAHETRHAAEARSRSQRFRKGLAGLWDRISGRHARLYRENEADLAKTEARDAAEKQALIDRQLEERRRLQLEIRQMRRLHLAEAKQLRAERIGYEGLQNGQAMRLDSGQIPARSRRPSLQLP